MLRLTKFLFAREIKRKIYRGWSRSRLAKDSRRKIAMTVVWNIVPLRHTCDKSRHLHFDAMQREIKIATLIVLNIVFGDFLEILRYKVQKIYAITYNNPACAVSQSNLPTFCHKSLFIGLKSQRKNTRSDWQVLIRLDATTDGAKWRLSREVCWIAIHVWRHPLWKSFGGFGWMHLARSPSVFRIRGWYRKLRKDELCDAFSALIQSRNSLLCKTHDRNNIFII